MASQETPNYRLSRWAGTDRILVEEFNDNWDKIDTALKGNADGVAALQTALAGSGNCGIAVTSYTGAGAYGAENANTLRKRRQNTHTWCRQQSDNPSC